jgi:hypothetical protein
MNENRIEIVIEPRREPDLSLYIAALIAMARAEIERERRLRKPATKPAGDAA